jgi:hypothetical protein
MDWMFSLETESSGVISENYALRGILLEDWKGVREMY